MRAPSENTIGRKSGRGGAIPSNIPLTASRGLNVSAIIDLRAENRSGRLCVRPGAIPLQDFFWGAQLVPFPFKFIVRLSTREPCSALRIALFLGFLDVEFAPFG